MKIKRGDLVIIFGGPNKIYLAQVPKDENEIQNKQLEANLGNQRLIHNRNGIFDLATCIGKEYGQKIFWDPDKKGHWVVILKPTPELITKSITHHTQILYRADISLILLLLDLLPGKRVVESGTGSGSLSYSLATAILPNGHLFTFDFHSKRKDYAVELFEKAGLSHIVSVNERDAYEKSAFLIENSQDGHDLKEQTIDAVFLDLPSPWKAIYNVNQVIKHFGRLVTFTPCIEQAQKMVQTLHEHDFSGVRTFEILCKPWGINLDADVYEMEEYEDAVTIGADKEFVNYQLPQLNHTGYLTVATANRIDGF
ncbi:tRNA methyltransferase complex GCD14 subunit containing protein [Theileria equi strain WA]|uniref:tRNA (adenine(58)-N(1))-methyltransferase n=1 Tax=Theileria equi strain WA TaxID=1537102 RepID=L0AYI7_THEEQ|nr:tRNA methyltransferase complex GCD14 subunit containing protein [Theileria equi strain WA]AFZ80630.1 tRNA methyltransferase complex GCD14 subunit containing protein [Theileria equi strain WA]|eukprot:XP_004830296.1 tRNA methyltransferase complex GCD14 subunit containing protein [Theileria equi strain WA]